MPTFRILINKEDNQCFRRTYVISHHDYNQLGLEPDFAIRNKEDFSDQCDVCGQNQTYYYMDGKCRDLDFGEVYVIKTSDACFESCGSPKDCRRRKIGAWLKEHGLNKFAKINNGNMGLERIEFCIYDRSDNDFDPDAENKNNGEDEEEEEEEEDPIPSMSPRLTFQHAQGNEI